MKSRTFAWALVLATGLAATAMADAPLPQDNTEAAHVDETVDVGYASYSAPLESARRQIARRLEALEPAAATGVRTASYAPAVAADTAGSAEAAARSTAVVADAATPGSTAAGRTTSHSHPTSGTLEDECFSGNCCREVCCWNTPRCWVTADYLYWWIQGARTPALITTSPQGTPLNQAGVLGQPGTQVFFGNTQIDDDGRSGGRVRFGTWLDDCASVGFAGEIFGLENASTNFVINSNGNPILARPFFDPSINGQNRQIDAFPGAVQGGKVIDSQSQLLGAGASALCNLCQRCWCCDEEGCDGCQHSYRRMRRIDLVMGYRYLRLDEEFTFLESAVITNPNALMIPVAQGTRLDVSDMFDTQTQFHGGEIGLQMRRYSGRWSLDALGKVALGNNRNRVQIDGSTVVTVPGLNPVTNTGGFLALPTNIGSFTDDDFSVIPELNFTLGYQLGKHVRARFGYTFLYWTNVLRASEQVDTVINPTQFPLAGGLTGPERPAVLFNETDIWIQGLNAGLEFTW